VQAGDVADEAQKQGHDWLNTLTFGLFKAKAKADKTAVQAEAKARSYSGQAQDVADSASRKAGEYADSASKKAGEYADSTQRRAGEAADEARNQRDQVITGCFPLQIQMHFFCFFRSRVCASWSAAWSCVFFRTEITCLL
jgi:uncharacterized protein YggE